MTPISKGRRYTSRRACSFVHVASMCVRFVSWSLRAKCLMKAYTPLACAPWISSATCAPASSGSSEKYSKLRPAYA